MHFGRPTVRDAIVLVLTDGDEVETPVQQRANTLLSGTVKTVGPVLRDVDFTATLSLLREMHRHAVAS